MTISTTAAHAVGAMSAGAYIVSSKGPKGNMDIDLHQLIWDGRWTALEMLWHAVVVNITTHWWFGPLLTVLVIAAGWKKIARFGVYVARTFGQSQGG
jgi:hypothetical protein